MSSELSGKPCCQCGRGPEGLAFGLRTVAGRQYRQAACTTCRGTKKKSQPVPIVHEQTIADEQEPEKKPAKQRNPRQKREAFTDKNEPWDTRPTTAEQRRILFNALSRHIHDLECDLLDKYGEDHIHKVPNNDPLEQDRFKAESLLQELSKLDITAYAGEPEKHNVAIWVNGKGWCDAGKQETIELKKDWTQCRDCTRAFTQNPKAAGWRMEPSSWQGRAPYWTCPKCIRQEFNEVWSKFQNGKGELELHATYGKENVEDLKLTFTEAHAKKRVKELTKTPGDPLELEMWQECLKEFAEKAYHGNSHGFNRFAPVVQRLIGWESYEPPEVVAL